MWGVCFPFLHSNLSFASSRQFALKRSKHFNDLIFGVQFYDLTIHHFATRARESYMGNSYIDQEPQPGSHAQFTHSY